MAERVASILAEIGIDASKFKAGAGDVLGGLDDMLGSFGVTAAGAAAFTGALTVVAGAVWKATQAAEESNIANAKLNAVLKATGGAAGYTSDKLNQMADDMSRLTGIDDEVISGAQSIMLTFKNIRGDNFRAAMLAAADLSAVMGTDLKSSVVQVSKALNDFDGFTALKRAGVSFSEEQERMIANFKETNDLAGYQALVLKELQGEFDGSAAAINAASLGINNLNVEVGNLWENLGQSFVPAIKETVTQLTELTRLLNENAASWKPLVDVGVAVNQFLLTGNISGFQRLYESLNATGNAAANSAGAHQMNAAAIQQEAQAAQVSAAQQKALSDTYSNQLSMMGALMGASDEMTAKIVYNNVLQKASIDGLTEAEFERVQMLGIALGIFDEKMAAAALRIDKLSSEFLQGKASAMQLKQAVDSLNLSNQSLAQSQQVVNATRPYYTTGGAPASARSFSSLTQAQQDAIRRDAELQILNARIGAGTRQYANGGSFVIPSSYGREGFRLGNMGTASGGETVTITPAGRSPGQSVMIENISIGDTSNLRPDDIRAMMRDAVREAMGVR